MLLKRFSFDPLRKYARYVLYLTALCLLATSAMSAQEPDEEEEQFGRTYVRRFSAGARFLYLPLTSLTKGSLARNVTDFVTFNAITSPSTDRFAYGLTTQITVKDKWALAVEASTHKVSYVEVRDTTTFIVDPFDMLLLETQLLTDVETTSARIWDVPVLLRYYTKGRRDRGARVFFEGGVVIRRVSNVKTSIETTFSTTDPDIDDMTDCCDKTPARVANSPALGGAVGIGVQLIDDVGIRVVPGFRYIRWFNNAFDNPPTRSEQNQLEVSIALTF